MPLPPFELKRITSCHDFGRHVSRSHRNSPRPLFLGIRRNQHRHAEPRESSWFYVFPRQMSPWTTDRPFWSSRSCPTQLLSHLNLGDMQQNTKYPFLFEAAPEEVSVAAAAAAAAATRIGGSSARTSTIGSVHSRVSVRAQAPSVEVTLGYMHRRCLDGNSIHWGVPCPGNWARRAMTSWFVFVLSQITLCNGFGIQRLILSSASYSLLPN